MAHDARDLTDRELLLQVYDDVLEMKADLLGRDGRKGFIDETRDRLSVLETKVDERTPTKREQVALPAGLTAVLVIAWEYIKHKTGVIQ